MEYNTDEQIQFDIVSESQLAFNYLQGGRTEKRLKILSLFSGCGGMDLGVRGRFCCALQERVASPGMDRTADKRGLGKCEAH